MKKLAETTIAQLFNFTTFLAALVIFINNALDYRYRYANLDNLDDVVSVANDMVHVLASVIVMFMTISSPFEEDSLFEVSIRGTDQSNSLPRVLFFTGLCFVSSSELVEDPSILFSELRTLFDVATTSLQDLEIIDTGITEESSVAYDLALSLLETNLFGEVFSKLFMAAKCFCFAASLIYAVAIVLSDLPDVQKETVNHFIRTIFGRAIMVVVLLINAYSLYLQNYDVNNIITESERRIKQLASLRFNASASSIQEGLGEDAVLDVTNVYASEGYTVFMNALLFFDDQYVRNVSVGLLMLVAAYVVLFYKNHTYSLPTLLCLTISNLSRMGDVSPAEDAYSVMLLCAILLVSSTLAFAISHYKVVDVLYFIPNIMYKIGLLLSVAALPFVFISYTHQWLEISLEPVDVTGNVLDLVDSVDISLGETYSELAGIVQAINPCVRPLSVSLSVDGVSSYEQGIQEIDEALIEMRLQAVSQSSFYNLRDCIASDYPHEYIWGNIPRIRVVKRTKCKRIEQRESSMRKNLLSSLEDEILQSQSTGAPITELAFDDPYYIDKYCEDIKCGLITGVLATLFVLSLIPFIGTAAVIMSKLAEAGYKIYRLASRVFKKLPRLAQTRIKIKRLKRRLKLLRLSQTQRSVNATKTIAWVFFPVVISAAVGITLLMIRRQQKKSNSVLSRLEIGMKIAIGIALPMIITEFALYVVMIYFPRFLSSILEDLPEELVSAELETGAGYEAVKFAYLISFVGNTLLAGGAIVFVNVAVIDWLLMLPQKVVRGIIRGFKVTKYLLTGAQLKTTTAKAVKDFGRNWKSHLYTLLDWKAQYFQPLIFSAIPIPFIIKYTWKSPYVDMEYNVKTEASQALTEINDSEFTDDAIGDITSAFDNAGCGLFDRFADALSSIANLEGNFLDKLVPFRDNYNDMITSLSSLQTKLTNLLYVDKYNIKYPIESTLESIIVYAVPVACTCIFAIVWAASILGEQIYAFRILRSLLVGEKTQEKAQLSSVAMAGASLVATLSITFVLIHIVVGSLFDVLAETNIPFLNFTVKLGSKHYMAIICHACNLMSAVAYYVNVQIPPTGSA